MSCSRCGGSPKPRPSVPQPSRPGISAPVQRNGSGHIRDAIGGVRYGGGNPTPGKR